jgi:hypothetical protein
MSGALSLLLVIIWTNPLSGVAVRSEPPGNQLSPPTPESRALAYLAGEVPRWSADNKCYSCHNNGDAARALYTAVRLGHAVPAKAHADTSRWLSRPQQWDHNGGEGPANDKGLARIQFAAALADAIECGQVKDRKVLIQAAEQVAEFQQKDGSWQADAAGTIGSPATYGTCLATCQARRILKKAEPLRFANSIAKADRWLQKIRVQNILDAAAALLGLEEGQGADVLAQRRTCMNLIKKGQSDDGGWGPYVTSGAEPFDTAVVLLALVRQGDKPDVKPLIQHGRAFLLAGQQSDGSWQETTRPAGAESYAQRISTTGWATLALLATCKR